MSTEHVTSTNPNGAVRQCQRRDAHEAHEYQAEFGALYNVHCPGNQTELLARAKRAERERDWLAVCLKNVLYDLHRTYGSTTGPYGGIGRQAITAWCHVNNPYDQRDDELQDRAYLVLRELDVDYERVEAELQEFYRAQPGREDTK